MRIKSWIDERIIRIKGGVRKMMKCMCSGEHVQVEEVIPSPDSLATRDYSASIYSSRAGENDTKIDNSNIEEAESSLRESDFLNYEEARALLGRLEFQKGNLEGALHVFEGINISSVIPKMKTSIMSRCKPPRRHSLTDTLPTMSIHAVSLLFEAIFLKAKSLQALGRFTEAAQSCKVLLDTVESALPEGLPGSFAADCKFQEIINKAVELLPDLWILSSVPEEAIVAYRRALLYKWNLDTETKTIVEKKFAVFLLYSGTDATSPNLRSQMESSFVPINNIEEAALLLLILLRKFLLGKIGWDPSLLDHLSFALAVAGDLRSLAHHVEELPPGIIERRERYNTLALCYYGEGQDLVALNLLRNLLNDRENQTCTELLLASKICGENSDCLQEGIGYAQTFLLKSGGRCNEMVSLAHSLLGISLSSQSRTVVSDVERISKQSEALEVLETAANSRRETDPNVLFHLSVINAEQRKLNVALYYAKQLLKYDAGSSVKGWILSARILSAQRRYVDAENIINAALDETGKWDQGELMRTKAKLQIAQGHIRNAVETYTHLLAVLQVRSKNFGVQKQLSKNRENNDKNLEMETWNDLANVYTSLSQWRDAEVCLSKSSSISPHSASRWYSFGLLYEGKGLYAEALKSFENALDVESNHVPSLIATGVILRKLNDQSLPIVKCFLTDALKLDRTNPTAWYNLGLIYKAENGGSVLEAAECFEAAAVLQESEPIEPFR